MTSLLKHVCQLEQLTVHHLNPYGMQPYLHVSLAHPILFTILRLGNALRVLVARFSIIVQTNAKIKAET